MDGREELPTKGRAHRIVTHSIPCSKQKARNTDTGKQNTKTEAKRARETKGKHGSKQEVGKDEIGGDRKWQPAQRWGGAMGIHVLESKYGVVVENSGWYLKKPHTNTSTAARPEFWNFVSDSVRLTTFE